MVELDRELLRQARSLIDGTTVHNVGSWLLAYELSPPGSSRSRVLESLLRDFVCSQHRLNAIRNTIETQREWMNELSSKSIRLNHEIHLMSRELSRRIQSLKISTSD
jgi:hypothetical protein